MIGKGFTMTGLVVLGCLVIGGCGMKVNESGRNIMIEFHPGDSSPAYKKAQEICEAKGMNVKLERTDCPQRFVSTYECVPKD